ncbi:uncharacterized protein si:ch211-86h15.1 [Pangasianodon hypophthalmus]|uniref:uncharacterized protein si:ch211-86h15.1 n=1 Tax=Pangasianodon hypophthalmus TaxID=310915 RepID=UPI0023078685|nr:uncharacterized protein si:ch211-86h15.1 [Pangasianodon hypophthalmus]
MTNLQSLSIFLTERLMLAAQEIFKAVEVTVTEYHDEISRSRQENELLKNRLLEAGIQVYPELQPGLSVFHGEPCAGSERGDPGEKIQVKQEPSASREEPRVPPPQTSVPEEPVSPPACLEDEQRIEEMLQPQMTESSASPLLQAHHCMQIKEETDESKSALGTEIFCVSQSSTSDDPSSAVASNHSSGLETELDGLSSMHNASELRLTSRVNVGQPKTCVNYDPAEQDKELQRRERMFHMVKFSGMETVAVVPAEWYNAGETLWPNYKTDKRMERAVQRRETPGEDWDRYNCTVLKTYDNYSAAHQALKSLSCSTSDVQSDEGEEVNAKPKPIHYIGESDVDSDPNESRTPVKKQRTHQKVHRFPSSSTQTVARPTKPHSTASKMTPPLLAPPATVISCPEMNTSSWEAQLLFHPTCRVRTGTGPILCTAAQLHMLTLMEQVKHEQTQILGMLNGLNTKLDANTELQSFFDTPEDLKFPLDTIEDVEHFEAWLAEATNAGSKNNLIKILSTLGGQDVKKVTWNILAHIFSDNVSKKICWKGANQKLKFSGMNTKGLLIRAVRNCKVSSNATEEEISKHAIRWFNLASDRGGGRKERHRLSTAGRTTDEQNSE